MHGSGMIIMGSVVYETIFDGRMLLIHICSTRIVFFRIQVPITKNQDSSKPILDVI